MLITKKNPAHIPAFPFLVMMKNTTGNRPSSVAQTKWNSTQNIRNRTKQRLPAGFSSENKSMPIKLQTTSTEYVIKKNKKKHERKWLKHEQLGTESNAEATERNL
ncbi:hypothetical protein CDAR_399671 [Caerostris darwini]|uniref:Uncharacterized protein n=1 Tax=Caerostris darwini TaxID=1538125 RepID=A0AAV4P6W5_9ARAC|nr:hypothetical protein CDAR_399671 [Caerostris darwini]